jgi:hypothetical protein
LDQLLLSLSPSWVFGWEVLTGSDITPAKEWNGNFRGRDHRQAILAGVRTRKQNPGIPEE